MKLLKNPLILALDVDTRDDALRILENVGHQIGGVKLGPRLVYRYGSALVAEAAKIAPVFIDNKYFDISSTMLAAVRTSFEAGATLVTVHALAGSEALHELSLLESELNTIRPFRILAVTILTSWDSSKLPASLQPWPIEQHVQSLSREVYNAGLRGLVCSGHELGYIAYPDMFKVIPGIRSPGNESKGEDQKRIMTPNQAMRAGASALVIGRPILLSKNPNETIMKILESCADEKK